MKHSWMGIVIGVTLAVAPFAVAQQPAAGGVKLSDGVVKIGVLTDLSGAYSDLAGAGSVVAVKMAIEDFQAAQKGAGFPIEVVTFDHQNKPDIASNKAREWFERDHVDMITDLVTTSTALAVMPIAKEKDRITIVNGAASTPITGKFCNDRNVHYTYDTYALANGTGKAVVKQGGNSWFFLTADYAFG
jgi:branched-chain amino acid transport system substrate-binding protein